MAGIFLHVNVDAHARSEHLTVRTLDPVPFGWLQGAIKQQLFSLRRLYTDSLPSSRKKLSRGRPLVESERRLQHHHPVL